MLIRNNIWILFWREEIERVKIIYIVNSLFFSRLVSWLWDFYYVYFTKIKKMVSLIQLSSSSKELYIFLVLMVLLLFLFSVGIPTGCTWMNTMFKNQTKTGRYYLSEMVQWATNMGFKDNGHNRYLGDLLKTQFIGHLSPVESV